MQKQIQHLDEAGYKLAIGRLQEISQMVFGDLSDEIVLEILAERRSLTKDIEVYDRDREIALEKSTALAEERTSISQAIADLNARITPDKDDDTLLTLIQQRKALEERQIALDREITSQDTEGVAEKNISHEDEVVLPETEKVLQHSNPEVDTVQPEALSEESKEVSVVEVSGADASLPQTTELTEQTKKVLDPEVGTEGIYSSLDSVGSEEYLKLLESNPDEALARLESLSTVLRKDKRFMLQVAAVDPAYAMHYADAKSLKKDKDFNLRVAAMENHRNSGNPLAEMLSEMRTGDVVTAAIKRDFRNIRYATPAMPEYATMLDMAKKGAREKVLALGQAVDLRVLLPKTLRDDREFMVEIESLIEKVKEKTKQAD